MLLPGETLPASSPLALFRENKAWVTLWGGSSDTLRNGQPRARVPFTGVRSCCIPPAGPHPRGVHAAVPPPRSPLSFPCPSLCHQLLIKSLLLGAGLSPSQLPARIIAPVPPAGTLAVPVLRAEQLRRYGDLELSRPRFGVYLLGKLLEPFPFPHVDFPGLWPGKWEQRGVRGLNELLLAVPVAFLELAALSELWWPSQRCWAMGPVQKICFSMCS